MLKICQILDHVRAGSLALASALLAMAGVSQTAHANDPWKEIETLVESGEMNAAITIVDRVIASSTKAGDEAQTVRARIRKAQLQTALGAIETATVALRDAPRPQDIAALLRLEVHFAQTVEAYLQRYGWEIRNREQQATPGARPTSSDLRSMTTTEIRAMGIAALARVWTRRDDLKQRPITELADDVEVGNYPAGIRSSLRDFISRRLANLLADSTWWSPAESADAENLKPEDLLDDAESASRTIVEHLRAGAVADSANTEGNDDKTAAMHPLSLAAAVLSDLETWHRSGKRPDAALEAFLERTSKLHATLATSAAKRETREILARRIEKSGNTSWLPMGLHLLATFLRESDDLQGAHRVVERCTKLKSSLDSAVAKPGLSRCQTLLREITAPRYEITAMALDGKDKRSIQVTHANLRRLYFRAWKISPTRLLSRKTSWSLMPSEDQMRTLIGTTRTDSTWTMELPATPDFKDHITYSTPKNLGPGLWAILASAREDFVDANNKIVGAMMTISDLVVVGGRESASNNQGKFNVEVLDGATGKLLPGVGVALWRVEYEKKPVKINETRTDAKGAATLTAPNERRGRLHIVATNNGHTTIDGNLTSNYFGYGDGARRNRGSFIYSDRSVYRPGQKLKWKSIHWQTNDDKNAGSFVVQRGVNVEIVLRDANWQIVARQKATTNDFGSASGTIAIPTGKLLGRWTLGFEKHESSTPIQVEEYKRPTFAVTIESPTAMLKLGKPAKIKGQASYYFGAPVSAGSVAWKVSRTRVLPWWRYMWFDGGFGGDSVAVATGNALLAADGTFAVEFTPNAAQLNEDEDANGREGEDGDADTTWNFEISADITDSGGETRSGSTTIRIGRTAVESEIAVDGQSGAADTMITGVKGSIRITRRSLAGSGSAGRGSWQILQVVVPADVVMPADEPVANADSDPSVARPRPKSGSDRTVVTPGDLLRPRWAAQSGWHPDRTIAGWSDGKAVASGELTHDARGVATFALPKLNPGYWRVRYETKDEFGQTHRNWKLITVAPEPSDVAAQTPQRQPSAGTARLGLPLLLKTNADLVEPGRGLDVVIGSGIVGQRISLELQQAGRTTAQWELSGNGNAMTMRIPIKETHRGGFALVARALHDWQHVQLTRIVAVPWTNKVLEVTSASIRDRLKPGSKETWRFTIAGAAQRPRQVHEVLSYMYDRSLDIFATHDPMNPMGIHPDRTQSRRESTSLDSVGLGSISRKPWFEIPSPTDLTPEHLKDDGFVGGGFGGRSYRGSNMRSMAAAEMDGAGVASEDSADQEAAMAPSAAAPSAKKETTRMQSAEANPRKDAKAVDAPVQQSIRKRFDETAYWQPHLTTDNSGNVTVSFTVPDALTSWSVRAIAHGKDLASGLFNTVTRTARDVMVRPYLPRFFRELDAGELRVMVNNTTDKSLTAIVRIELVDTITLASRTADFGIGKGEVRVAVPAAGSADAVFKFRVPRGPGEVMIRTTARTIDGTHTDGEEQALAILPGRMHLMESRFATLRGNARRTLDFPNMRNEADASLRNDRLVVTLDGQLIQTVLAALPSLVNEPYECTEQTMNRFVSTSIVTSLMRTVPSFNALAKHYSNRQTELAPWSEVSANARLSREEMPWAQLAMGRQPRGDNSGNPDLVNILNPARAASVEAKALEQLQKMQLPSGGFPWFPGGPASKYMTLYLLSGFSRVAEFGGKVPSRMIQQAWRFVGPEIRDEFQRLQGEKTPCCIEQLVFANFVASGFSEQNIPSGSLPAELRAMILDFSFKHWRKLAPMPRAWLALTLTRAKRNADAVKLFDSILDSAKTSPDLGTSFDPEERAWLWYADTVDTQAFALRALTEITPGHKLRDGLAQWLLLNRKLTQWKSTRATAEAIYALVHYLRDEGSLGDTETIAATVGGKRVETVFDAAKPITRREIVVAGSDVRNKEDSRIEVERSTKSGKGISFASATWHFSTDALPKSPAGDFFAIDRRFFVRRSMQRNVTLEPLTPKTKVNVGDEIEVQISVRSKHAAEYIHLRDPRGAGFEPAEVTSGYSWDQGLGFYREVRDSGANFFIDDIPVGEFRFRHRLRATMRGTWRIAPAEIQSMYAPEFGAYSSGIEIVVE